MLIFFPFLGSGVFVKLKNVIKHLVSNLRFDLHYHESPAKKSGNNIGQGEEHSSRDEESETIHFAVAVLFQNMCPPHVRASAQC